VKLVIYKEFEVLYSTEIACSARVMEKLKFIAYVSGLCIYVLSFKTVPPENSPSPSDHENEQTTEEN
jgi:hypothetical protein